MELGLGLRPGPALWWAVNSQPGSVLADDARAQVTSAALPYLPCLPAEGWGPMSRPRGWPHGPLSVQVEKHLKESERLPFLNTATGPGELLGEAALRAQIPRSFLRGPLREVWVAFIVAVTKGRRALAWGGTGCDALDNAVPCCFCFLVLASRRPSLNVRPF